MFTTLERAPSEQSGFFSTGLQKIKSVFVATPTPASYDGVGTTTDDDHDDDDDDDERPIKPALESPFRFSGSAV